MSTRGGHHTHQLEISLAFLSPQRSSMRMRSKTSRANVCSRLAFSMLTLRVALSCSNSLFRCRVREEQRRSGQALDVPGIAHTRARKSTRASKAARHVSRALHCGCPVGVTVGAADTRHPSVLSSSMCTKSHFSHQSTPSKRLTLQKAYKRQVKCAPFLAFGGLQKTAAAY